VGASAICDVSIESSVFVFRFRFSLPLLAQAVLAAACCQPAAAIAAAVLL
jgi:hypothetical protein